MLNRYRMYNSLAGWITFLLAAVVYMLTIEPTVSFWDCGEFIAASYKLEVGHPPGAPLFLLLGRLFSLFAPDPSSVALMVNSLSALFSAFTILFLFWTITHLSRKILITDGNFTSGRIIAILGAAFIGSTAYTFSDTFWFSAVEGEVYATSSLFTALVFWAILKWEDQADQPGSNRWLVLIAYLMGLSVGVHLLNLLAIPAIVLVYYFRKYKPGRNGIIVALSASLLLLAFIQWGLIPGIVKIASWFELFFVNTLGLPFHSGALFYIVLLISLIIWILYTSHTRGRIILNTLTLFLTVFLIGYSSYTTIIIRSSANPPMDQNNPDNVFDLLRYLNREQYQSTPLIRGPYYNAPVVDVQEGKPKYARTDGKYVVSYRDPVYKYDQRFVTFFPRMYSSQEEIHRRVYEQWGKIKGTRIPVQGYNSEREMRIRPTFSENLRFFFRYQLGHMYFRYFMWNFAGRQNDIQGHGSMLEGNWISGIPAVDNPRLGPQENLPQAYKDNAARNRYYLLPFLLGLAGIAYLYLRNKNYFLVTTLLFIFTGIAIVVYLNQYPYQPRERDYAYAASFYVFAAWMGMGVLGIRQTLFRYLNEKISSILATLVCLIVPVIMAAENWDDHDRSGRFTARDFAWNYLNSCEENAILFTNGDNDTFPLWYLQEVEGVRTDVRVVNLSYLGAGWYISQMKAQAYNSPPVPFSLTEDKYIQGTRDILMFKELFDNYQDISRVLEFIASDDPRTKVPSPFTRGENIDFVPARKLRIPVDTLKIIEKGIVPPKDRNKILPHVDWQINKELLYKNDMMIIDLMATNRWERPVYFAITIPREVYLDLEPFFQVEGFAYRVVPLRTEPTGSDLGNVNTEKLFENMVSKFRWGNIGGDRVYLDENNLRMFSNSRNNFARLALTLISEGKMDQAASVLEYCEQSLPVERIPHNYFSISLIEAYYLTGNPEKADQIAREIARTYEDELRFLFALGPKFSGRNIDQKQLAMYIIREITQVTGQYGDEEISREMYSRFQELISLYNISGG